MSLGLHGPLLAAVWVAAGPLGAPPAADPEPRVWIVGPDGARFRVRFDEGQRLMLGAGADLRAAGPATSAASSPVVETGLFLRSTPPAPGWTVAWRSDHEIAHLRLGPAPLAGGAGGAAIAGVLYHGLFLRRSRTGTITLPLAQPIALSLPFDIGLLAEVGRLDGTVSPTMADGASLTTGIVHGEIVADFWRANRPGCWLLAGLGARYDARLARDPGGALAADHRVAPMTALSLAAHAQRGDGLLAGGARLEAARRWSSARGWEQTARFEAEVEGIPVALNDRPLSLFAAASVEAGGGLPASEVRVLAGARFWQPLR